MEKNREPIELQVNKRYPTFQLSAEVRNKGTAKDLALKLCVLEVMAWLRKRFVRFDPMPEELLVPSPKDYQSLKDGDIRSFHLDLGHTVDVLYAPEEGLWAFRLIEPDPGANLDSPTPRLPVIGRMFETNIAIKIASESVQVGFCTICSEPAGHMGDCEVFRPVAVKNIANNPLLGLRQVVDISPNPRIVDSDADLGRLRRLIENEDRTLPILLITEPPEEDVDQVFRYLHEDMLYPSRKHMTMLRREPIHFLRSRPEQKTEAHTLAEALAKSLLAFAHVVICKKNYFPQLEDSTSRLNRGDWAIVYPNGLKRVIPYSRTQNTSYLDRIKADLKLFPKRRAIDYHGILFFSDAQIRTTSSRRRNLVEYGEQLELLENKCQKLSARLLELEEEKRDRVTSSSNNEDLQSKQKDLQDKLEHAQEQREELQKAIEAKDKDIRTMKDEVEFYKRLARDAIKFPTTIEQIESWINESLADYLILHDRAAKELRKVRRQININALCEGIYFLTAHARYLRKEISSEQRKLYRLRYNWETCPVGNGSLRMHREHYEIVIAKADGTAEKRLLDEHIKYGRNAHIIRIYYLWDGEIGKIIIGSLPDHLPTSDPY